ncbi:MAG: hypothetical protein PHS80_08125 [Methanothrix sp.]|nr:hypothetical protein [Methanothrix sp.]MDD4447469.1 hypothetical protein [Methanothrix sp.]
MGLASLLFIGLFGMSLAEPNEDQKTNGPHDGMGPQDAKMMSPQSTGFLMGDPIEVSEPNGNQKMNEPRDGMGPQDAKMVPPQNAGFPMGVPLEVLFSGHGFALVDNESHILRLKVESILPLEPDQIKDLLASNKSLEEIRDDIRAKEGEKTNRGSMILDRSIYPLINIVVSPFGNNSTTLKADLADSGPLFNATDTAILGSISMTISPSDGGMIGKGELLIEQGLPAARYSLLIDMEPSRYGRGKMMTEMSR